MTRFPVKKKGFSLDSKSAQEAHWGCYALVVCRAQNCKLSQVGISQRNPRKRPSPFCSCLEKLTIQGSMEGNLTVIFEPLNPVWLFATLLEFAQIHNHWVGDANQPSHPLLPPFPPALNLPQHRVFSNELALYIRWPKYRASLIAQMVKNVPAVRETRVWSLGREDPWRREWQPTAVFSSMISTVNNLEQKY